MGLGAGFCPCTRPQSLSTRHARGERGKVSDDYTVHRRGESGTRVHDDYTVCRRGLVEVSRASTCPSSGPYGTIPVARCPPVRQASGVRTSADANVHAGTFDIRGFEMQVMHFPPTSRPASTSFLGHQRLVQRSGDTKQMAAPRRTQRWSNICVGLSRWERLMSYGFRHSMRQP